MKFGLLHTIAIHFLAASLASAVAVAVEDYASPLILDDANNYLMDSAEAVSAKRYDTKDVSVDDGESALDGKFTDQVSDDGNPDYCFDDSDFDCFKEGVPTCCIRSGLDCPSNRPRCDLGNNRIGSKTRRSSTRQPTRAVIRADGYCNPDKDVCISGFSCTDGICQRYRGTRAVISAGGYCNVNEDTCVSGFSCTDGVCAREQRRGRTRAVTIGPNAYCNVQDDVCVSGYSCTDGTCRFVIDANGSCNASIETCVRGYFCFEGRCQAGFHPYEVCRGIDSCVSGYSCINGVCDRTSSNIRRSSSTDVGGFCSPVGSANSNNCVRGSTCIGGICQVPNDWNGNDRNGSGNGWNGNDRNGSSNGWNGNGCITGAGGDCSNTHCCSVGSCRPSNLNGSDRWYCTSSVVESE